MESVQSVVTNVATGFGRLFYVINPNSTTFEHVDQIPKPDYVVQAIPYFLTLLVIEVILQHIKGKKRTRVNDAVVSMSHGLYLETVHLINRSVESATYIWIYNNFSTPLPWDSPRTWYIAALLVDFCYYWVHRATHEINLLWTQHQIHHSSEDYNLTTALRQPAFQTWFAWVFYLPMAFFVPPSIFLVHQQFNLIFQFWIHTEVIDHVGPLEWIINTPRHHGSNRYCLDKNYAGVLIIWDRMFGTFADEKKKEKIVYGLVEDVNSFNPFWLQFFYYPKLMKRFQEMTTWGDKLSVFLKGPGWSPGKPRLGDPQDVPKIPTRQRYDPKIPSWQNIYVVIHFALLFLAFDYMSKNQVTLSQTTVAFGVIYILASLTSLGLILENRQGLGVPCELGRLVLILISLSLSQGPMSTGLLGRVIFLIYSASFALWSGYAVLSQFKFKKD